MLTNFSCNALTGTESNRTLATLSEGDLLDGDRAFVTMNGNIYFFVYDTSSTAQTNTTERPYLIRPNDYSASGVWIEQGTYFNGILYGTGNPPSAVGLPDGTLYFKYED